MALEQILSVEFRSGCRERSLEGIALRSKYGRTDELSGRAYGQSRHRTGITN